MVHLVPDHHYPMHRVLRAKKGIGQQGKNAEEREETGEMDLCLDQKLNIISLTSLSHVSKTLIIDGALNKKRLESGTGFLSSPCMTFVVLTGANKSIGNETKQPQLEPGQSL